LRPTTVTVTERIDRHEDALDREAALVVDVRLVAALDDLRVDDGHGLVVLARVEDEQPLEHADLGGGEADAAGVVHQALHPRDEASQLVVELLHGARLQLQRSVRILADLREGKPPPSLVLGVQLLVYHLSIDVRHAVGRLPTRWTRERSGRS